MNSPCSGKEGALPLGCKGLNLQKHVYYKLVGNLKNDAAGADNATFVRFHTVLIWTNHQTLHNTNDLINTGCKRSVPEETTVIVTGDLINTGCKRSVSDDTTVIVADETTVIRVDWWYGQVLINIIM